MYLHKEGHKIIGIVAVVEILIIAAMILFVHNWTFFHFFFIAVLLALLFWVTYFFRITRRVFHNDEEMLLSPADGVVVAIEQIEEKEYIKGECLQISVFMNGYNQHINRYPCDGVVEYCKFHRGNYFVASYPKSSVLNEHTTIGLRLNDGQKIVIRQVAGTMARRIVCYAKEGDHVRQNQEMGFIKFGSRVDIFVPKHFTVTTNLEEKVRNAVTPLCKIEKE